MTMQSMASTASAHSGNAENAATWAIALRVTKTIATTRAQPRPLSRPPAVRPMMTPSTRLTQPHVVKSSTMTPRPPTVTTSSFRIAASPQIELKKAATNSMIPANEIQPLGTYSSRGTEVRGAVVAIVILSPRAGPDAPHRKGERSSPASGDARWPGSPRESDDGSPRRRDALGSMGSAIYEFRVRGKVSEALLQTFQPLESDIAHVHTLLHGPVRDQAELHGLLDRLQALGLELLEVRRLPPASGRRGITPRG